MGQPAARMGDLHVCPMVTPGVRWSARHDHTRLVYGSDRGLNQASLNEF